MSDDPSTVDGPPPRQARGNGLPASAWVPLRDVDPRYAATLLDALREASVPAYVAPATGVRGPYLDVHLPSTPTDRLFVDARRRTDGERVVAATLPGLIAALDDEAWAGIVAMFNSAPNPAAPGGPPTGSAPGAPGAAAGSIGGQPVPWPAAEDMPPGDAADDRPTGPRGGSATVPVTAYDPFDDDHFEPPDPGPAPPSPPVIRYAWMLLIGGLVVLVVPVLVGYSLGSTIATLAVVSAVSGFGMLIYQMKDSPPTDSGPDDGAVV